MSWDIFVQDLPPDIRTAADIPDTFRPAPLGTRADLIQRIRAFATAVSFADPSWGTYDAPTFSIEFNLGSPAFVLVLTLFGSVVASSQAPRDEPDLVVEGLRIGARAT